MPSAFFSLNILLAADLANIVGGSLGMLGVSNNPIELLVLTWELLDTKLLTNGLATIENYDTLVIGLGWSFIVATVIS